MLTSVTCIYFHMTACCMHLVIVLLSWSNLILILDQIPIRYTHCIWTESLNMTLVKDMFYVFWQVSNRGEAHLELNAFRRKHDCALVISGDSLEVKHLKCSIYSTQSCIIRIDVLALIISLYAWPIRSACGTTSMNLWSWRVSAPLWFAVAALPRRKLKSFDCYSNIQPTEHVP